MEFMSCGSFIDEKNKFSVRYVEDGEQRWYIARDIFKSMKLKASITQVMPRIASLFWRRCNFMGHNVYLLSEEGCRYLINLYKHCCSQELKRFLGDCVFVQFKAIAPTVSAFPVKESEEIQSLKAVVKANQGNIEQIQNSINQLFELTIKRQQETKTAPKPPSGVEEVSSKPALFIAPAKREDWRTWSNFMVTRLITARGDSRTKETAAMIWKILLTPIEKAFNVNFWDMAREAKKLRGRNSRGYVTRLSIVNTDDSWMHMLIENIVAMAKEAEVSLEIPGIPMTEVPIYQQKATA